VLTDAEGRSSAAKFLMHTYRVVTRRTHRVRYIYFGPYGVGRSVPIRVKIESDDQPEDEPEVSPSSWRGPCWKVSQLTPPNRIRRGPTDRSDG
jgi:hypothetical protein